jgi:hypothetical protein
VDLGLEYQSLGVHQEVPLPASNLLVGVVPPLLAAYPGALGRLGVGDTRALERVMNSIRNGLGMRETEIAKKPSRPWNPHSYAVFAQVHNTL